MDPSTTIIDESVSHSNANWVEFYGDVAEEDPPLTPEPLGDPVSASNFLNSDHA